MGGVTGNDFTQNVSSISSKSGTDIKFIKSFKYLEPNFLISYMSHGIFRSLLKVLFYTNQGSEFLGFSNGSTLPSFNILGIVRADNDKVKTLVRNSASAD